MPRFEVEPDVLVALARQALEAADAVATADLGGAVRWGATALPGAVAASVLDESADLCRHVVALLGSQLASLSERLSAAATTYHVTDSAVGGLTATCLR
jgi:hypothetical protein